MKYTSIELGAEVRHVRKSLNLTQEQLALAAGTGLRFIGDLENGKPTCHLGKTLRVIAMLGINIQLTRPPIPNR
jgi:HTH-type transcriptional regulator / antitoxin HipB